MATEYRDIHTLEEIIETLQRTQRTVDEIRTAVSGDRIRFRDDVTLAHSTIHSTDREGCDGVFEPTDEALALTTGFNYGDVRDILDSRLPAGEPVAATGLDVIEVDGRVQPHPHATARLAREFDAGRLTVEFRPSGPVLGVVQYGTPQDPPETLPNGLHRRQQFRCRLVFADDRLPSQVDNRGLEPVLDDALKVWGQTRVHRLPSLDDFC